MMAGFPDDEKTTGIMMKWTRLKRCISITGMFYLSQPMFALAGTLSIDKPAPYEQCGYCHEYDGNPSLGKYPKLNGQKKQYLLKQLRNYKNGQRDGKGMMQTAVAMLSDEDIQVVANYFSTQKPVPENVGTTDGNFEHAREIWTKGIRARQIIACRLCHLSSEPEIPNLVGQHAEYLASQLHAFKHKTRTNDVATIMRFLAERLSEDEIAKLSQYLAAGAK